ncbi:hypothetical protein SRHO_G00175460 [Serrasalmus rhombeus]
MGLEGASVETFTGSEHLHRRPDSTLITSPYRFLSRIWRRRALAERKLRWQCGRDEGARSEISGHRSPAAGRHGALCKAVKKTPASLSQQGAKNSALRWHFVHEHTVHFPHSHISSHHTPGDVPAPR